MAKDGKQLETLVAFVESQLVPEGFSVTNNRRVYHTDGTQLAEFDVVVEGRVGTGILKWLIECRDRPSEGAAPSAWIEQLIGRRQIHSFHKVTAVSTTGFAPGAVEAAKRADIELREISEINPLEFEGWLSIKVVQQVEKIANMTHAGFGLATKDPKEMAAFNQTIASSEHRDFLINATTGMTQRPEDAFAYAVEVYGIFESLDFNDEPQAVDLMANYDLTGHHYSARTIAGDIPIFQMHFKGFVMLRYTEVPVYGHSTYRGVSSEEVYAEVAKTTHVLMTGHTMQMSINRLGQTGETVMRVELNDPKK